MHRPAQCHQKKAIKKKKVMSPRWAWLLQPPSLDDDAYLGQLATRRRAGIASVCAAAVVLALAPRAPLPRRGLLFCFPP